MIYGELDGNERVLKLKLANEEKVRHLASIDIPTKTIEFKRDKAKHLHRATKSYGINQKILLDGQLFDKVIIKDDESTYTIPKEYLITHGKVLFYKQQGFEKQIFIPLDDIQQFRSNAF